MALPREYTGQQCSVARALEIVGERWTLLIVRDAFFGVRRFTDFASHLEIPRAVLTERLGSLVEHGILERTPVGGRDEYVLTAKGHALWPIIRAFSAWGDDFYSPDGPRRLVHHVACGAQIDRAGNCPACGRTPTIDELEIAPGPGLEPLSAAHDPVSDALRRPHRLLEPIAPLPS